MLSASDMENADQSSNYEATRNRGESWKKISLQKKRRNTIIKLHNHSIIARRHGNSMLKLKKVESSDADISNFGNESKHEKDKDKDKEFFNDDDFFAIMEKRQKRISKKRVSIKKLRNGK